jgi:excisionase family DNA binding protein
MGPAFTTSEAARELGISKSTLIRAVRRGDIRASYRTPGQHLRFTADDLAQARAQLSGASENGV